LKTKILGVKIDVVTYEQALKKIDVFLASGRHHVVTPNPEFVLEARSDREFRDIINKADMAIPDGFGLVVASRFTKIRIKNAICGSDLVFDILFKAEQKNLRILFLNIEEGLSSVDEIVEASKKKYPELDVRSISVPRKKIFGKKLFKKVADVKPNILFVAFGSPHQDKWIARYLKNLPSVRLAMGVGGSVDFLTNKRRRAPKFFRALGLEWLHRLFSKPLSGNYHFRGRIKKVFKAVIVFPLVFIFTFNKG